jgi:hypothetical protein
MLTFTGTPTGATVFVTDAAIKKPAVYNGTSWTDFSGTVVI